MNCQDCKKQRYHCHLSQQNKEGPLHIEETLDRKIFESLSQDLLDRLLEPVQIALDDSGWNAEDIDEVVLVGGSTRIPMVQQLVKTLVPNDPCQSVNPDEVVAVGAAIQSGIISGDLQDLLLNDVTPLSLGFRDYWWSYEGTHSS